MNKQKLWIAVAVILILILAVDAWAGFSKQALDSYAQKRAFFLAQTEGLEFENQWLGVRLQQFPNDLQLYAELLYEVKPDIIVETGTFHGASALYLANVMENINPDAQIVTIGTSPTSI